MTPRNSRKKNIKSLIHQDRRSNIPTAEYQASDDRPRKAIYERRNRDLDPQLVWRGKDEQDAEPLVAQAPPLYIQEKVHPKAIIDSIARYSICQDGGGGGGGNESAEEQDLFADFNGLPSDAEFTDFYRHEANWSNRMILGDSLHVMASLAERENLRGKVQCIYLDPPYGIKFNSNFQWSTTSRDIKDGKKEHITREPEQVRAFRDTWRDGIHSYLGYIRDRLMVARDLLTESGSIFVQIGDENVHRVRAVMDEVFGAENFVREIAFRKTSPLGFGKLARIYDTIIWYAKSFDDIKYRQLYFSKSHNEIFRNADLRSSGYTKSCTFAFRYNGQIIPKQKKLENSRSRNKSSHQS